MDERLWLLLLEKASGGALGWLAVAYLAGMFATAAFRPQAVASPGLFRTSVVLFGLYLITPPLVRGLVVLLVADDPRPHGPRGPLLVGLTDIFGVVMLGVAVIPGLGSLRVGAGESAAARGPARPEPPADPVAAAVARIREREGEQKR